MNSPVAWRFKDGNRWRYTTDKTRADAQPLYASTNKPRLTDEQIDNLWDEDHLTVQHKLNRRFIARAVEKALGIK